MALFVVLGLRPGYTWATASGEAGGFGSNTISANVPFHARAGGSGPSRMACLSPQTSALTRLRHAPWLSHLSEGQRTTTARTRTVRVVGSRRGLPGLRRGAHGDYTRVRGSILIPPSSQRRLDEGRLCVGAKSWHAPGMGGGAGAVSAITGAGPAGGTARGPVFGQQTPLRYRQGPAARPCRRGHRSSARRANGIPRSREKPYAACLCTRSPTWRASRRSAALSGLRSSASMNSPLTQPRSREQA